MFELKFTDYAVADVKALPKNVRNGLKRQLLEKVKKDPIGCSRKLREPLGGYRSFHWRDYRVVFRIFPELRTVAVVGVGKHSREVTADIYRKLEALAEGAKLAETVLASLRGFREGE